MRRPPGARLRRRRGFGLLELAVVLTIVGLVLAIGSYAPPWLNERRSLEETRRGMIEARDAVVAFSLTNNRLPCPANPAFGIGDPDFGKEDCSRSLGTVPHEALLLSAATTDRAHRAIVYGVYRNAAIQADLAVVNDLVTRMDEPIPVLDSHDYCRALENGDPEAGTGFVSTSTSTTTGGCAATTFINQAFVLASAGLEDADGDLDPFDGYNADLLLPHCFASPQQGRSATYDDLVLPMSFAELLGEVCR